MEQIKSLSKIDQEKFLNSCSTIVQILEKYEICVKSPNLCLKFQSLIELGENLKNG